MTAADEIETAKGSVQLSGGAVDLGAIVRPANALRAVLANVDAARTTLEASASTWTLGPISRERAQALAGIEDSAGAAARAVAGIDALPALLGANGERRYFVAFDTPAELRGTGGVIGYYAVLVVRHGKISLGPIGRPEGLTTKALRGPPVPLWFERAYGRYGALYGLESLNLSADFPSMSQMLLASLPPSIGSFDGVIQLDPQMLSAFLKLTGPVAVPAWPGAISSDTVERITEHDSYIRFAANNDARIAFLGELVSSVFERLFGRRFALDRSTLSTFGTLAGGGHIQVYSTDPSSQRALEAIGLARDLTRAGAATDVLGVVGNNFDGNKIDWYLSRKVSYDVTLHPSTGEARSHLDVDLHNDAPSSGVPDYVIGSLSPQAARGTNRQLLVILRTHGDDPISVTNAGTSTQVSRDAEQELVGYHDVLNIPPHASTAIRATLVTANALAGNGRDRTYILDVLSQPTVRADAVSIAVHVPRGWSVDGPTTFSGPLTHDVVLQLHLHESLVASMFDAFIARPFRLAVGLLRHLF